MKNRRDFQNLIKQNPQTSLPNCHGKIIEDVPSVALEFFTRQAKLSQLFLDFTAEQGIRWLFGYANYINQNYAQKNNVHKSQSFSVGTLVMVDFFGSFGYELTFDHPAIVLKDFGTGLVIAPLTSNPKVYAKAQTGRDPLKVALPKNISTQGNLYKNSTVRLNQIRYIDKSRILYRMVRYVPGQGRVKQRVSFLSTLEEIERAISKSLSPHIYSKLEKDTSKLEEDVLTFEKEKIQFEQDTVQLEQERLALEQERLAFEQEKADFLAEIASKSSE